MIEFFVVILKYKKSRLRQIRMSIIIGALQEIGLLAKHATVYIVIFQMTNNFNNYKFRKRLPKQLPPSVRNNILF